MDVHASILDGSSFIDRIAEVIRSENANAEWALKLVASEFIDKQASAQDAAMREKHIDIADVADRLQRALAGTTSKDPGVQTGAVIIAKELRPSTVVELSSRRPAAIITDRAGWTSHTSILARELGIPMVSGITEIPGTFTSGQIVAVDAFRGEIILDPTEKTLTDLRECSVSQDALPVLSKDELTTLDGTAILIRANVDSVSSYLHARDMGAKGIGLFRSESLIKSPDLRPSEEDQLLAYIEIADAVADHGVKIRTFDIEAGDPGARQGPERNPALGLRSLRLSLDEESLFRSQLRALVRASVGRSIDIILPMVSGVNEIRRCRELLNEISAEVRTDDLPKLGAMIEVPSAIISITDILDETDFLCLGTNDLVQYLLAVDRDNDAVAGWYQTLHPAVIKAIRQVLSAAADAGTPVTVCGEMAGSPFYVPLLIGLGARELSMNTNSIQRVRRVVAGIKLDECNNLAATSVQMRTAEDIEIYLRQYYKQNWQALFPPGLLNSRHL
jgi:phosphotransferase system enzyme I (PtsI)